MTERSNDPQDYGMKMYQDQEVADHSITIGGLSKHLGREEVEIKVRNMMTKIINTTEYSQDD